MTDDAQGARDRLTRHESREVTRRRLIDSATELFARFGVAETSLRTVAEHAGYSRGAVHSNFDDKTELAEAVALHAIAQIGPSIEALLTSPAPSGERLEAYIRAYLEFCTEHPTHAGALIAVALHQTRFNAGRLDSRVEESLHGIITLFEDGQHRGQMRPFDPWLMAHVLRSTLDATAARLAAGTLSTPAPEAATEIVAIFDLATRKETR